MEPADLVGAGTVPDLAALTGPVIGCDGPRGVFQHSDAGYAALGQLIADITGAPYAEAAARLVLRPLAMADSSFPASWPGSGAITGYTVTAEGSFAPAPASVATMQAAGGLWSTAGDLVRFGLGWIVNEAAGVIGHGGTGPAASASLLIATGTGDVRVALAHRVTLVESVSAQTLPAGIRRTP